MRTKLPAIDFSQAEHPLMKEIRDRDWTNKIKGKEYADKRRRATTYDFEIGDKALLKQNKVNKLSSHFNPEPFKVEEKGKGQVTVRNKQGVDITRSMGHAKQYFEPAQELPEYPTSNTTDNANLEPDSNVGSLPEAEPQVSSSELQNHQGVSRGQTDALVLRKRSVSRPARFSDCV